MKLEELSSELQEKLLACETGEDVIALAKAEGIELSDEDLEAVSGGLAPLEDWKKLLTFARGAARGTAAPIEARGMAAPFEARGTAAPFEARGSAAPFEARN